MTQRWRSTKQRKNKSLDKRLEGSDHLLVARLTRKRIALIEDRGTIKKEITLLSREKGELETRRNQIRSTLKEPQESNQTKLHDYSTKIYAWLEKQFEVALDKFKVSARESVEKLSTEAWLKMILEPREIHWYQNKPVLEY